MPDVGIGAAGHLCDGAVHQPRLLPLGLEIALLHRDDDRGRVIEGFLQARAAEGLDAEPS